MVKAAGLFQAFTRNMAYGVKALIDQRIAAGEAPPEPAVEAEVAVTAEPAEIENPAPATENPAPATENPAPATENDAPAADAAEPAQASEEEEE
jgi:hypothetical protein